MVSAMWYSENMKIKLGNRFNQVAKENLDTKSLPTLVDCGVSLGDASEIRVSATVKENPYSVVYVLRGL